MQNYKIHVIFIPIEAACIRQLRLHAPLTYTATAAIFTPTRIPTSTDYDFDYIQHVEHTAPMCDEIWPKT